MEPLQNSLQVLPDLGRVARRNTLRRSLCVHAVRYLFGVLCAAGGVPKAWPLTVSPCAA